MFVQRAPEASEVRRAALAVVRDRGEARDLFENTKSIRRRHDRHPFISCP